MKALIRSLLVFVLGAASLGSCCFGDCCQPTDPVCKPALAIAGTWSGSLNASYQGATLEAAATLSISEDGHTLGGTWSASGTFSYGGTPIPVSNTGVVTGTVGTVSDPSVRITVRGRVCSNVDVATLSGSYDAATQRISLAGDLPVFNVNTCQVVITFPNVPVTLSKTTSPAIVLIPTSLTFTATQGVGNPTAQTVTITNGGDGTLSRLDTSTTYSAGQPTGWLDTRLSSTTAPSTLTLAVTTGGLTAGTYTAAVNVSSPAATNSPQSVNVTFDVNPPSLMASLEANPASGRAALTTTLTATASGTATGTLNYTIWWNCTDPGTSVSAVTASCGDPTHDEFGLDVNPAIGAKFSGLTANRQAVGHTYTAIGSYTAKVIIERDSAPPAEARTTVTVPVSPWTTKAPMPTPRAALGVGVVNGVLYAVGGCCDPGHLDDFSTLEAYDPVTDSWTTKASMPTARRAFGVGVVNGILYAVGGIPGTGNDNDTALATVEAYDPTTDSWTTKASMPTARRAMGIGVVNGILYAVGGRQGTIGSGPPLATVEAYDPATDSWTTKAPMPGTEGLGVGVVNGILYAVDFTLVAAYDPVADAWTTKASMPTPRFHPGVGVVNGILYAVGGSDYYSRVSATVEAYDPSTDSWTTKASMPTPRYDLGVAVVNGILYAVGGQGSGSWLATVEAYPQ
jgi:energy-converting hydrogenase Eha subunit A